MPSRREKSGDPPEILQHLGRAALAYGISRLGRHESDSRKSTTSKSSAGGSRERSKKSKGRSKGSSKDSSSDTSERTSKRKKEKGSSHSHKSDNGDLHHHITQLAAGALAFGVRQYMHHRREKRREAATASAAPSYEQRGTRAAGSSTQHQRDRGLHWKRRDTDPELSTALESLTSELRDTSESIRRLTRNRPSHRNCEVHRGLVENSDRIQASLSGLQTSVNNMVNLHPGLGQRRSTEPARRDGVHERARESQREPYRGLRRESPREYPKKDPREMPNEKLREQPRSERDGRKRRTSERYPRGRSPGERSHDEGSNRSRRS